MNTATNYFSQAELALAAYAELQVGIPDEDKLKDGDKGLSAKQAEVFAQKYNVVAPYNDTLAEGGLGTGLSVTVFQDKESKQLTVAIRGTELSDTRDISTDVTMIGAGVAYDQLVSLYNWWQRETTAAGTQVQQFRLSTSSTNPQAVKLSEPKGSETFSFLNQ